MTDVKKNWPPVLTAVATPCGHQNMDAAQRFCCPCKGTGVRVTIQATYLELPPIPHKEQP